MQFLLTFLLFGLFESNLENAFTLARNGDWSRAASALDQAAIDDPEMFDLNNLSYLRGRVAENQQEWGRARSEFARIAADSPLSPLATWHGAKSAMRLGDLAGTMALLEKLPRDFPAEMRMQLAAEAPPDFAIAIYQTVTTREARLRFALSRTDHLALWTLLRELNSDDAGLEAARTLATRTSLSPRDALEIAEAFFVHRQFADSIRFYESAGTDAALRARSQFQIARAHFLSEEYRTALDGFTAVAREFAGSNWQKDSEYQIASCYWRLGEYQNAAKAYSDYITRYGGLARNEGAVRNIVDVYRLLGDNATALSWLNRGLAVNLSLAGRQSLLFTKAKVLFIEKQYAAALPIFQQLGRARLRATAGGTTRPEARYSEALTNSKLGRTAAGNAIWKQLAAESFTYYGQKSAERLGQTITHQVTSVSPCEMPEDSTRIQAEEFIIANRRSLRTAPEAGSNTLTELQFLQLWDEAAVWIDRQARPDPRLAADLSYLGGRYHRAIVHAGRMPKSELHTHQLQYPAGFRELICKNSMAYSVDPLWLHAIIWQESKYNPFARSGASARGLMQFIPETATEIASAVGNPTFSLENLYDPAVNIQLGAYYWSSLLKEFKQPELALAAYNGGPDNVRRWKGKWRDGDEEFFVSDIGFMETKTYVMAVFGARGAYGSR